MERHPIENTDLTEADIPLASYDTLLGQLQRGRGIGFLRALQADPSEAHDLLYNCITVDPRVDRQVEERADYYARLVRLTHMSLASFDDYLHTAPHNRLSWEVSQTIEVLGRLCQLGDTTAPPILKEYVAYGAQWDYAIQQLAELADPNLLDGLPEIICARFKTGAQLEEAAAYDLDSGPAERALWKQWALENPCITKLLHEIEEIEGAYARAHPRPIRPDYEELSVTELLSIDARQGFHGRAKRIEEIAGMEDEAMLLSVFTSYNAFSWYSALRGLQALNTTKYQYLYPEIFAQSVSRLESFPEERGPHISELRAIRLTLELLPPALTLPLARKWLSAGTWNKESTAEDLLERHATREDLPMVIESLTQHLQENTENVNSYRTCSLLDIISLFPDIGPIPQAEQVFVQTVYSQAQRRAASAMSVNAPQWFAETYAYECMWDCAEEIRQIGCESVSLDLSGSTERLQELVGDSLESELIREAARLRLNTI